MSLKTNNRYFIFICSDAHSLLNIQTKIMKIDILKAFEIIQLIQLIWLQLVGTHHYYLYLNQGEKHPESSSLFIDM